MVIKGNKEHKVSRVWGLLGTIPAAAMALMFWHQRAVDPLTAPSLILDRALQLATLLMVPAAVMLVVCKPTTRLRAVTYLAGTGLVLSVSVFATGLFRPPANRSAILISIATAMCSGGLLIRHAPALPGFGSRSAKIAGGLVGLALPLLQFWNGASFLPSQTEASLQQKIALHPVAVTDGKARGTVSLEVTNDTNVRVVIIISNMTICWWAPDDPTFVSGTATRGLDNCTIERPIQRLSWISPHSKLAFQQTLSTPASSPHIAIYSRIAFARGDRLRVGPARPGDDQGDCTNVEIASVQEESRLKGLAQSDKRLVFASKPTGGITYHFDAGANTSCQRRSDAGLDDYFGTTETAVNFEDWLVAPSGGSTTSVAPG